MDSVHVINAVDWIHVAKEIEIIEVKSDEHFFKCGIVGEKIGLVLSGLGYVYYTRPRDGDILIRRFVQPGDHVAPFPAIIDREPARDSLMAIKNMRIATVPYKTLEILTYKHPSWERFVRKSFEKEIRIREEKEYEVFVLDATERYLKFLTENSKISAEVPQHLIASYLGISPQSLSRIKNNLK